VESIQNPEAFPLLLLLLLNLFVLLAFLFSHIYKLSNQVSWQKLGLSKLILILLKLLPLNFFILDEHFQFLLFLGITQLTPHHTLLQLNSIYPLIQLSHPFVVVLPLSSHLSDLFLQLPQFLLVTLFLFSHPAHIFLQSSETDLNKSLSLFIRLE